MKLVATIVISAMFVFGVMSQRTSVNPVDTVVIPMTTAAPVLTTIVQPATTIAAPQQVNYMPKTTLLEPWISLPTTTTGVLLTSHEPRTELERLICDPQWAWNCEEAIAVATCESSMNSRAVSPPNRNGTIDRGLFQVNDVWKDAWSPAVWERIFVARTNIAMAHHIWEVGGNSWKYWTCQP